jgi:cobalt-zinc-cadmium efflux system outer membrane protein
MILSLKRSSLLVGCLTLTAGCACFESQVDREVNHLSALVDQVEIHPAPDQGPHAKSISSFPTSAKPTAQMPFEAIKTDPAVPDKAPVVKLAGQQDPAPDLPPAKMLPNADVETRKSEGAKGTDTDASERPKPKLTLPMAIGMCVANNLRVQAGAERIGMAEGDLVTSSLIPNPSLFADCQLIPLREVDITNQLGPPQWDALTAFPIDWLLFGKRVAAMQAARLGVEVSRADFENVLRVQLAQTVDTFFEVLMDDAYFRLAEKNVQELGELEELTRAMAKDKKVGALELDRIQLAVHEAILERHDRELALELAKARLRPLLGRTAADPDYEVEGALTVGNMVPPPKLEEALALAEAHRPDLIEGQKMIDQANALVELERRRAKPQVAVQPGWSYQDQASQTLFHNGSMFDIGISTTLPLTDRNQGNIRKAEAAMRERRLTYRADRADALAEVETSVASYADAVEHLTKFNTPETLEAAHDLRRKMEAAYRDGDRMLIEMLDAQKAYVDRLGHIIEFESFYWRSLNKLNAAVGLRPNDGGSWQMETATKHGAQ